MKFNESVVDDIDVFMDTDEFAEEHAIEYQNVECIVDTDVSTKDGNHNSGITNIRVFIREENAPSKKEHGDVMNVDGSEYLVDVWDTQNGITVITLYRYNS